MAFELDGVDALLNDLGAMAAELAEDGRAINKALKAGAQPIHQKMKANASIDPAIISGDLHRSIHAGPIKKRGTGKRITIGVHAVTDVKYATFVEFGHGGPAPAPAHPFVRPAFDTELDTAYDSMIQVLRAALDRRA